MAALAPSISHALAGKQGAFWIEVCSAVGAQASPQDGDPGDPVPASTDGHVFEHCPYCSLHANAVAIPAVPSIRVPEIDLSERLPAAFLAAPRTLHAWLSAQPRAPPPAC